MYVIAKLATSAMPMLWFQSNDFLRLRKYMIKHSNFEKLQIIHSEIQPIKTQN